MKIVINKCYGGFGLSKEAFAEYCSVKNIDSREFHDWEIERNDPVLVEIVEKMGTRANDQLSQLKIVDVPADIDVGWCIEEYDGMEWIAEPHRTWG